MCGRQYSDYRSVAHRSDAPAAHLVHQSQSGMFCCRSHALASARRRRSELGESPLSSNQPLLDDTDGHSARSRSSAPCAVRPCPAPAACPQGEGDRAATARNRLTGRNARYRPTGATHEPPPTARARGRLTRKRRSDERRFSWIQVPVFSACVHIGIAELLCNCLHSMQKIYEPSQRSSTFSIIVHLSKNQRDTPQVCPTLSHLIHSPPSPPLRSLP